MARQAKRKITANNHVKNDKKMKINYTVWCHLGKQHDRSDMKGGVEKWGGGKEIKTGGERRRGKIIIQIIQSIFDIDSKTHIVLYLPKSIYIVHISTPPHTHEHTHTPHT